MEATVLGLPSFAVSLVGRGPQDYTFAAAFSQGLARQMLAHPLPEGTLLNVNVPPGQPLGWTVTRLGRRAYAAAVVEKMDPRSRPYYWIGGDEQAHQDIPGTDCNAVFDGRLISVTPLHLDLTQDRLVGELSQWELPGARKS
jgi:5'-nucleotidase